MSSTKHKNERQLTRIAGLTADEQERQARPTIIIE